MTKLSISQEQMTPEPQEEHIENPRGKLADKVAIITGGDSGIGRSVALLFAKEGADIMIVYLEQDLDAQKTKEGIESYGRQCQLFKGDIGDPKVCNTIAEATMKNLGTIDIVVNNAAEQTPQEDILKISPDQLQQTFRTNIFSYFYMVQSCLPHMHPNNVIINTTSVTAYRGSEHLLDYSSTKGAIVSFTRSLSQMLVKQGIRVNAVAPGPIWTPLIPSTFPKDKVEKFGIDTPMQRPGQPAEIAPCYLFLASDDSSYMTGQVLHPNGGEMVES